jgi:arylsulfatase A-like enzyme
MKKTHLMIAILTSIFLTGSSAAVGKTNMLLIMADDLGYSDLGCYGGEIKTPHLDNLAYNGLRYTQAYNTARCWPTRSALMTGYYPQQINIDPRKKPGIPKWGICLPQRLKTTNYRCYISGKWHVTGVKPQAGGGFDETYVLHDHDHNFYPGHHESNDQPLPPISKDEDYYVSTAFADHAIKCLQEHSENHADQPFFSYLAFTVPHFPLQVPQASITPYRGRYDAGWNQIRAERIRRIRDLKLFNCKLSEVEPEVGPPYHFPDAFKVLGPNEINRPVLWNTLTEDQKRFQATKMELHAAMVAQMDEQIGRVIKQIKSMNAFDNTIIIFLSDNGCSAEIMVRGNGHNPDATPGSAESYLCLGPGWSNASNTPFRKHKTWVHEGGCCTPLIVHWPNGIREKNALRDDLFHVVDIVPTLLDIAGVKAEAIGEAPPLPGRSIVPSFAKAKQMDQREPIYFSHEGNRAIRMGDWKLVSAKTHGNNEWELYNLAEDRSECENLAEKYPERVKDMAAKWNAKNSELFADAKSGAQHR